MFKFIKRHLIFIFILLSVINIAQAKPIFDITPNTYEVNLGLSSSADITFTIKNTTGVPQTITNVALLNTGTNLFTASLAGTCTNVKLANDGTCTETATLSSLSKQGINNHFGISVCAFNGSVCSTLGTKKIKVTVSRLTSSASNLALSVNDTGTNAALTGKSRTTTITNTGAEAITNLVVTAADLPTGTTAANDCSSSLAPSGTCTITITPGATVSSDANSAACTATGTVPVASTITVSADNATSVTSNVFVLGYGCQYQEGFIYSIDDTTSGGESGACTTAPCAGSIGGKVVSLEDQKPVYPNGVVWSSDGTNGQTVSYDIIYGVDEKSTSSVASPITGDVTGQTACDGKVDGKCNMDNIVTFYSFPNKSTAIPKDYYAAGVCDSYDSGTNQDWYLPAICEMGLDSNSSGSGCSASTPNIATNLPGLLGADSADCTFGANCLAGIYWSSTEDSNIPQGNAWGQFFGSGGSSQHLSSKKNQLGVRCSRTLTT